MSRNTAVVLFSVTLCLATAAQASEFALEKPDE